MIDIYFFNLDLIGFIKNNEDFWNKIASSLKMIEIFFPILLFLYFIPHLILKV